MNSVHTRAWLLSGQQSPTPRDLTPLSLCQPLSSRILPSANTIAPNVDIIQLLSCTPLASLISPHTLATIRAPFGLRRSLLRALRGAFARKRFLIALQSFASSRVIRTRVTSDRIPTFERRRRCSFKEFAF